MKENLKYKVVSFDIFDTLLLRPFSDPQEVWMVLENLEHAKGFARARKKADSITYEKASKRDGETTIEEAYKIMPKKFRPLMQKEMDMERKILRPNPEMLKIWNDLGCQGQRRVIVSDMYLPAYLLQSILCENGIKGWDAFYLSRDYNARKTTGKLFELILKVEGVKPNEMLHIGDNVHSDVKIPELLGIHTKYYPKVIDRFYEVCPFARLINGRLAGALAIGWHQFKFEHPDCSYWHRFGFIMGGVLGYLYVKWIVEVSRQAGKDHLMFVARDGYIWKAICDTLFPEINTEYFYAPRLVSIAVLGAIGSDPLAIKDRQKYIDKHLVDVDIETIKTSYKQYLDKFVIDDKTAMIDGCSSGFSAQRLVETTVGRNVFCFYLLAMAEIRHAAALYKTRLFSLQWQMLSEFIFGAPENPIKGIENAMPVYENVPSKEESLKVSLSQDIADGAVACAKVLYSENVEITPVDWCNYVDLFMQYLTEEDEKYLTNAMNAPDVEQKNFKHILYRPNPSYRPGVEFQRYMIRITTTKKIRWISLDRKGLHYKTKNISVQTERISMD